MHKLTFKKLVECSVLTGVFLAFALPSFGAPPPITPEIGGAINPHDMNMVKQKQREVREKEDFSPIQQKIKKEDELKRQEKARLKQEKKAKKNKKTTENEAPLQADKPVIKAKVEEYKTKGVYVSAVEIPQSEIIPDFIMNKFTGAIIGKNVQIEDVQNVVKNINDFYAERGYITARAFLPNQTIEGGVVKIDIIEGRVGTIAIEGNRWTRDSYIANRLGVKKSDVFDVAGLEREIIRFNRYNPGVHLQASLKPGAEDKTTDVVITTKEEFPFHIMGVFDNAGRRAIGERRVGAIAVADSLFGYRDKLTIGSYFSEASKTPFADYNIPVNRHDGRVGANFSISQAKIINGPYTAFNIESKSINYSAYYTQPLIRKPTFELSATASGHYKEASTLFDSHKISTDKITAAQVALSARWDTKRGIWYSTQSAYQAFPIADKDSKYFKYEGNLIRLHDFGHGIVGQLRSTWQVIPQDVIPYADQFQAGGFATVRGFSEGVLIGKSGFIISGELMFPILPSTITVNVRGKSQPVQDGIELVSSEAKKEKPQKKEIPFLGKYVKGILFIDQAAIFPYKGKGPGSDGIDSNDYLGGIGTGFRISLPGDLNARLYWAFPMINNVHEQSINRSGWGRFHFELTLAPDFDKLLKTRRTKTNTL